VGWGPFPFPGESEVDWVALVAEARIEEAMKEGRFDNLPGRGKPLQLKEYPFVPARLRVPYKILHDAGLAPAWIQRSQTLAELEERIGQVMEEHLAWLAREREAQERLAAQGTASSREQARARLELARRAHGHAVAQVRELMEARNRALDQFNQMVPNILWQKGRWSIPERLARFEAACRDAFPGLTAEAGPPSSAATPPPGTPLPPSGGGPEGEGDG